MGRRRKPQEIWDALPPAQKAALCCHTGTPMPLYAHMNFTVASIRALRRKKLWYPPEEGGGPTPLALRVVACAPKCPDIKIQINLLAGMRS